MAVSPQSVSQRRASLVARRADGFSSLSHLLDSMCSDLETTKEMYRRSTKSPVRISKLHPISFTKDQKYVQGKAELQADSSRVDAGQKLRAMRSLLSYSKAECEAGRQYLSRDQLTSVDVRDALKKYRRKFGESSLLQSNYRRSEKKLPTFLADRPLFPLQESHKEQLDRFISKYIDSHLRRKASLLKFSSLSAFPSPHLSPLGSPVHSGVSSPKTIVSQKANASVLFKKLKKLRRKQNSDGVDMDSNTDLLNDIRESSTFNLKDQSKLTSLTKEKSRHIRASARHLIL